MFGSNIASNNDTSDVQQLIDARHDRNATASGADRHFSRAGSLAGSTSVAAYADRAPHSQQQGQHPVPGTRAPDPTNPDIINLSAAELLTAMLSRDQATLRALSAPQQRVVQQLHHVWAETTWTARINLLARFKQHCSDNNIADPLACLDWAITTFVEATETSAATRLTYAKTLAALYHRFGHTTPILQLYQASLRNDGATIPTRQAVAATPAQVDWLMRRANNLGNQRLVAALFIQWKTASRWDEVMRLVGKSVVLASSDEIIIEWLDRTKSTRGDPFRPSSWAVIKHDRPMDSVVAMLQQLQPEEELTGWTTETFARWLKDDPCTEELSAHSFKRGAIEILVKLAAEQLISPQLIPLLAKHKSPLTEFPSTTLRYASSNKLALARMLRTQDATVRIPCSLPVHQPEHMAPPRPAAELQEQQEDQPPQFQPFFEDDYDALMGNNFQQQEQQPAAAAAAAAVAGDNNQQQAQAAARNRLNNQYGQFQQQQNDARLNANQAGSTIRDRVHQRHQAEREEQRQLRRQQTPFRSPARRK